MFVDLDRFKTINDSLGHAAGDVVLKEVAQRLVRQLRVGDTVCRIGGDEFVVVLPEIKRSSDAANVAAKIIETAVAAGARSRTASCTVTPSIGIAVFPDDGRDAESADPQRRRRDVPRQGDRARQLPVLHRADEPGRLAAPRAGERPAPRAAERRDARVHYQPIVELRAARVAAHEALLRWQHPARGVVAARRVHPARRGHRA